VKTGAGAFMKTVEDSRELAHSLVAIGEAFGVRTEAIVTGMSAPLGRMVGNTLELIESIETLKGQGPEDVEALSVLLATRMLVVSGVEPDEGKAATRIREALASGAGVEKFRQIVEHQGGDPRVIDDYSRLPSAPDLEAVRAPRAGYVAGLHAEAVGRAAVALGAGRATLEDRVDHGVGVEVVAPVGAHVSEGDPVLVVHHRGGRGLLTALPLLTGAVHIAEQPTPSEALVLERIQHG
jgi:thymidine phosphorylase